MDRKQRQVRAIPSRFETRDSGDNGPIIEGYFAVFGSNYNIWDDMSESVDPHAFDETLNGDVRALVNHESTLVLGRTTAGTLELRTDETGLWGKIRINPNDTDAMNLYERVKRGDVNQCSFGFDIDEEEPIPRNDGGIHWLIKRVTLYEVSCCTFPAYSETNISARSSARDDMRRRELDTWRENMKGRLKHGT